jgi:hypothetical protein
MNYFKNEKELLESFGLTQCKGSGSGWLEKEDGYNDFILCQLKSTNKEEIRIKKLDLDKLEYNANVSHKIPLFIIQFIDSGEVYFLVKPLDIPEVFWYIIDGEVEVRTPVVLEEERERKGEEREGGERRKEKINRKVIKSSINARKQFWRRRQKEWEKQKKK